MPFAQNRIQPSPCSFCGSKDGRSACSWPEMKLRLRLAREAKPGDIWITAQKQLRARILSIDDPYVEYCGGGVYLPHPDQIQIWIDIPGNHSGPYPYRRDRESGLFTGEGPGVCGRWCCSNCFREVAEGRTYCRDHWKAWEMVA